MKLRESFKFNSCLGALFSMFSRKLFCKDFSIKSQNRAILGNLNNY